MTANVTSRYLGARIAGALRSDDGRRRGLSSTHERVGEKIAETLGQLKGPAMKIGQMASVSSGLLPAELTAPLERLRKDAPPAPIEVIAAQIETELGAPPEKLYRRFDPEPYAAASIGQVHRAVTDDGRDVVVKVQYPGIDSSVEADLAQLRFIFKTVGLMRDRREVFERFFAEISSNLRQELDYCQEADNIRLLAGFHGARHPFVHIPEVVGERSSQRVLTLTLEEGDALDKASLYSQEARDLIGERLVELIYSEIFELGALHADPNPANFAFRPDGSFALYDFGCLKRFTTEELRGLREILTGALDEDYAAIERGLITVGARKMDGPDVDPELYRLLRSLLEPALDPVTPFDVGNSTIHRRALALAPQLKKHLPSFRMPVGLMLVQRVNVGYYGNLRKLGARVRVRAIIERALGQT